MTDTRQKHLLIVDDEPDILQILDIIIKRTNTRVSRAENGLEALKLLDSDRSIDLVMTDIKMPELDGLELLREIKDRNIFTPPVIVITGFAQIEVDGIYDMGACGYIPKPFDWDEIIRNIGEALREVPRFNRPYYREATIKDSIELEYGSPYQATRIDKDIAIGQGGIFLRTDPHFNEGDLIRLSISFVHGEPKNISGICEVAWQREEENDLLPAGVGLKFIHLPGEVEDFVRSFVTEHSVRSYIPRS